MTLLNNKNSLFLIQIVLFIPIVLFMSCEQVETPGGEEVEYYNCIAYIDGSNITHECISVSSISPISWLYESEEECLSGCGNYNCINDDCVPEYGGQYGEQNDCLTICGEEDDLNYGYSCIGYDCVFEENGQYEIFMDCLEACDDYGYNCLDGDCVFEENGQHETLDECLNTCEGEGQVLFYLYDGVPNTIYSLSGETTAYFDIGDENNFNFVEVGNVSTITQSGYIITPLCVADINVVLVNVLTPPFGDVTYSWRVRNFLNTEYYDFGTFTIQSNECLPIEVDLK